MISSRLLFAAVLMGATCARAQSPPEGLQKSLDCMLQVLKTTYGVSDPKIVDPGDPIGTETTPDSSDPKIPGVTGFVCVQYNPDEKNRWDKPTEFCHNRASTHTPYLFTGMFPGLLPPSGKLDMHVSEVVVYWWNAKCGVAALIITG
jgi:hypothetical protein